MMHTLETSGENLWCHPKRKLTAATRLKQNHDHSSGDYGQQSNSSFARLGNARGESLLSRDGSFKL